MTEQNNITEMNFLFFFKLESLANRCCCGCSLKTGVILISIFSLLSGISLSMDSNLFLFLFKLIALGIVITGSIFLILSICNSNLLMAYKGYWLFSIKLYIDFFLMIMSFFSYFYDNYYIHKYIFPKVLYLMILYIMIVALVFAFKLYLIWIIFSYVKYMSKGDFNPLENNQGGYIKIENNL